MGRGGGGGRSSRGGSSGGSRGGGGRSSFSSSSRGGYSGGGGGGSLGGIGDIVKVAGSLRGYGRGGYGGGGYSRGGMGSIGIILAIVVIVGIVLGVGSSSGSKVSPSTIKREPLAAGAVVQTEYFTDNNSWIFSENELVKGLKSFQKATGVQPYVYITSSVPGYPTLEEAKLGEYANTLYNELFTDEAHCLLVWAEDNNEYQSHIVTGAAAKTVVDDEAVDIILDYLDKNYVSDMEDEAFFSESFAQAGKKIMAPPAKSPWFYIAIFVGISILLAVIGGVIYFNVRALSIKASADAAILNADVEHIDGNPEMTARENKYVK